MMRGLTNPSLPELRGQNVNARVEELSRPHHDRAKSVVASSIFVQSLISEMDIWKTEVQF